MNLKIETRWLVLLAIITFAVFANTLSGGFVYDDNRQILLNPLIQDPKLFGEAITSDVWAFKGDGTLAASNYWRPTFTAWSIVNFALFGANPFGWHLLNVLLHLAAVLLAYVFIRQLGIDAFAAFAVAALFSIHPVHSESVAWISGSPDILLALFLIASWSLLIRWRKGKRQIDLIASIVLYLLALGSKETAIFAIPVYFVLLYFGPSDERRSAWSQTSIFAACAGAYFVGRYFVLGAISHPVVEATGIVPAIKSVPMVAAFYLRQIVAPYEIGENYWLRPGESIGFSNFIVPIAVVLIAGVIIWKLAIRSHAATVGASIFAATLLPALNISMFPSEQIVHDRYLYLPLLGFLIVAAAGIGLVNERFEKVMNLVTVVIIILASLYAYQTYRSNAVWHDGLTLWAYNTRIDPASASTWLQYGAELSLAGRHPEALAAYERASSIKPGPNALLGVGREQMALGDLDAAIATLRRAIDVPNEEANAYTLFQSYEALAIAYQQSGQMQEGESVLRGAAVRLPIYRASITEKLAVLLYLQGRKADALAELEAAVPQARRELLPASKLVFFRLGMLYLEQGRGADAKRALQEFLRTSDKGGPSLAAERKQAAEILRKS
jgi:tetratricopeptide (TPR) repeat protein